MFVSNYDMKNKMLVSDLRFEHAGLEFHHLSPLLRTDIASKHNANTDANMK